MEKDFEFRPHSTLTPGGRELLEKINNRMEGVTPEEYESFILERNRGEKAKRFAEKLSEILGDEKTYEILEIGPGTGIFTEELNKISNIDLKVIDIRKDLVDLGIEKGRIQTGQAVIGDFEEMPFNEESFDVLTGMAVINQRREIEEYFSEMRRVLRDNGLVFFPWVKNAKGDQFNMEKELLSTHGFEIINAEENYILARKIGA